MRDRKNALHLGLALLDEAVDIIRQRIAPGFVARKPHLAIDVDIENTAGRPLQLHILDAALLKFRPDTQGLGFVASRAAVFDQDSHDVSGWGAVASDSKDRAQARRRPAVYAMTACACDNRSRSGWSYCAA
jgi:hypothetical protein